MDPTPPPGARVRWLVAGAFHALPSGGRFPLTAESFAEQLGRAAGRQRVTVQDRIGTGDASAYDLCFDRLRAFHFSEVIDSAPDLRALRAVRDALAGERTVGPEEAAQVASTLGQGRLATALAKALRGPGSPQDNRRAALATAEEALFATARDLLQHPRVAPLESAWRGLHWLWEHCPADAGMDIEVLDTGPHPLAEALEQALDCPALQRPDACFVLDAGDDVDALRPLAALGEQAWVPIVVPAPPSLAGGEEKPGAKEAWARLRADEASRWLCAAVNPVVMMAEQEGPVRRECFASPALAVAALLSASFRDTRTFARLVGPGSGTHAPAVWQPRAGSTLGTFASLSLREQERLAAQGLLGVGGFWDSDAVLLAAAPTAYRGRDLAPLPAQLLTGRLVRLAQALAERLPAGAGNDAVSALFSRASERFLSAGSGGACRIEGRVVPIGGGARGVHVRASLRPELAGTPVQLELTVPLPG